MIPVKITGLGRYLPERIVTASEIEAKCGLPKGWVESRAGVLERRWATHESNSFMAACASKEALAQANLQASDLDFILNASGTQEQVVPDGAPLIQQHLGLEGTGIPAFSVHATCLSFVVGLQTAALYIQSGMCKRVLVATSDYSSCGLNFEEPESAALLGDGAAAVILEATPKGESSGIAAFKFVTFSEGAHLTEMRGGGSRFHPNHPDTKPEHNLFTMQGIKVLRMAHQHLPSFLESLRTGLSTSMAGIACVVPHQASKSGLQISEKFGWESNKIAKTLEKYGNCVSASIPITLYEAHQNGMFQRGDEVLLIGTGAGLSIGGLILRF